jgi:hypothetical protein
MKTLVVSALVLGTVVLAAGSSLAQTREPIAPTVVIDMDADVIEADPSRAPKDTVVFKRSPHKFKSLIQVRQRFTREILASAGGLSH